MDAEKTEEGRKNSVPAIVVTKDSSDHAGPEKPRVVRKTSIRRRVSKDEKRPLETYGNMHEEYDKIIERMMADKGVQNTIEALTERWRMIMFMFEDCVETVKTRNENKVLGRKIKRRQELIATLIIYCSISFPVFVIFIILYIIIF